MKVNYIKHLTAITDKFLENKDLNASHISIYHALFQTWNGCNFQENLSVNRSAIMTLSKMISRSGS